MVAGVFTSVDAFSAMFFLLSPCSDCNDSSNVAQSDRTGWSARDRRHYDV